jgi:hypothetical protein
VAARGGGRQRRAGPGRGPLTPTNAVIMQFPYNTCRTGIA